MTTDKIRTEMRQIVDYLKKNNHSRRDIEKYIGWTENLLDQYLSKSGKANETALAHLRDYKRKFDEGYFDKALNEPGAEYIRSSPGTDELASIIKSFQEEKLFIHKTYTEQINGLTKAVSSLEKKLEQHIETTEANYKSMEDNQSFLIRQISAAFGAVLKELVPDQTRRGKALSEYRKQIAAEDRKG